MALEDTLVKLLTEKRYTISMAESCTGGLLSASVVNVSGASAVMDAAFVTYANEAKKKYVHVKKETLEKFGAVSAETAAEMAWGVAKETGADMGLSTTGIAGPDGGTREKPAGLVYIGCSLHGVVKTACFHFEGTRNEVRSQAVLQALRLALNSLEEE